MAMMPPRTPWHSQKKLNLCSLLMLVHLFLTPSSLTNLTPPCPLTQSFGYNIEYLCGYLKKIRNYPVNCSKCHFETFSFHKYSSLQIFLTFNLKFSFPIRILCGSFLCFFLESFPKCVNPPTHPRVFVRFRKTKGEVRAKKGDFRGD